MLLILTSILRTQCSMIGIPDKYPTKSLSMEISSDEYYGVASLYSPLRPHVALGSILNDQSNSSFLYQVQFSNKYTLIAYCEYEMSKQKISHFYNIYIEEDLIHQDEFVLDFTNYEGTFTFQYFSYQESQSVLQLNLVNNGNIQTSVISNFQLDTNQKQKFQIGGCFSELRLTSFPGYLIFEMGYEKAFDSSLQSYYKRKCAIQNQVTFDRLFSYSLSDQKLLSTSSLVFYDYSMQFWVKFSDLQFIQNGLIRLIQINQQQRQSNDIEMGQDAVRIELEYISETEVEIYAFYYSYTFPAINLDKDYILSLTQKDLIGKINVNILLKWHVIQIIFLQKILTIKILIPNEEKLVFESQSIQQFSFSQFQFQFGKDSTIQFQAQIAFLTFYNCYQDLDETITCHFSCETCDGPFEYNCLSCPLDSFRVFNQQDYTCHCGPWTLEQNIRDCFQQNSQIQYQLLSDTIGYDQFEPEIICSYGYFLYNNQCYQCPSSGDKFRQCYQCLLDWKNWVYSGECYEGYQFISLFFFVDEELYKCDYCQNFCSKISGLCNLHQKEHLNKPTFVACQYYFDYNNKICLPPKSIQVATPTCNSRCTNCQNGNFCNQCQEDSDTQLLNFRDCQPCTIDHCLQCFSYTNIDGIPVSTLNTVDLDPLDITDDFYIGCALCEEAFIYDQSKQQCLEKQNIIASCQNYYINEIGKFICLSTSTNNFDDGIEIQNCQNFIQNCYKCIKYTTQKIICSQCQEGFYINNQQMCDRCPENSISCYLEYHGQHWPLKIQPFYISFYKFTQYFSLGNILNSLIIECDKNFYQTLNTCLPVLDNIFCQDYENDECTTCKLNQDYTFPVIKLIDQCFQCFHQCELCVPKIVIGKTIYYSMIDYTNQGWQDTKCIKTDYSINHIQQQSGYVKQNIKEFYRFKTIYNYRIQNYGLWEFDTEIDYLNIIQPEDIIIDLQLGGLQNQIVNYYFDELQFLRNVNVTINNQIFLDDFETLDFTRVTITNSTFQNLYQTQYNLKIDSSKGIDVVLENIIVNQLISEKEYFMRVMNCTSFFIKQIQFLNFDGIINRFFQVYLNQVIENFSINLEEIIFINCSLQNTILFEFHSNNQKLIDFQLRNITLLNCTFYNVVYFQFDDSIDMKLFQISGFNLIQSHMEKTWVVNKPKSIQESYLSQIYINNSAIYESNLFQFDQSLYIDDISISNCIVAKSEVFVLSDIQAKNIFKVQNAVLKDLNQTQSSFLSVLTNLQLINITNLLIKNSFYGSQDTEWISLFYLRANQIFIYNYSSFDSYLYHIKIHFASYLMMNQFLLDNSNIQQKLAHFNQYDSQMLNNQLASCNNLITIEIKNLQVKNLFLKDSVLIQIEEFSQEVNIQMKNINFEGISMLQTNKKQSVSMLGILLQQHSIIKLQDFQILQIFGIQRTDNLLFDQIQIFLIQSELSDIELINFQTQNNYIANSSTALIVISSHQLNINNFSNFNSNIMNNRIYENLLLEYSQLSLEQLSVIFSIKSYGSLFKIKCVQLSIQNLFSQNSQAEIGGLAYITLNQEGQFMLQNSIIEQSFTKDNSNSQGGVFYLDSSLGNLNLKILNVKIINCYSYYSAGFLYLRPSIYQNHIIFENSQFIGIISMTRSILSTEFLNSDKNNLIVFRNLTILCYEQDILLFTQQYPLVGRDRFNQNQEQEGMLYIINSNLYLNEIFIYIQTAFEPILSLNSDQNIRVNNLKVKFESQSDNFLIKILGPLIPKKFYLKFYDLEIVQDKHKVNQNFFLQNLKCEAIEIQEIKIKSYYFFVPSTFDNNCLLSFWINKKSMKQSLLDIQSVSDQNNIFEFEKILIISIDNASYQSSLINMITKEQLNIKLRFLNLLNCDCNGQSCVKISSEKSLQQSKIKLINSKFINNFNNLNGTIQIKEIDQIITHTYFINNSGQFFGAALFLEPSKLQNIEKTYFLNNSARKFSGAIFSINLNSSIINNFFQNNQADIGMMTLGIMPWKLSLLVFDKKLNKIYQYWLNKPTIISVPSGQQLQNYQIFNTQSLEYQNPQYSYQLVIVNQFDEKQFNFDVSNFCQMNNTFVSKNLTQITEENIIYSLSFDENYQINLDQIKFIVNPYQEKIIQSSIKCPQISQVNYSITLYFKTYKCQRGEILYQDQCLKCNGNQGYFSFDPLIGSCIKINTNQIKNNTENKLELYSGYWRPQIFSSEISYCHNSAENCLGGWFAGDLTCQIGQIGALCEECDIYNIRGDGSFSKSQNYQCSNCGEPSIISLKFLIIFIWIMLQINLAVKNTQIQNEKFLMLKTLTKSYLILFKNYQEQSGTLFKLVINYFQMISLFSIVQTSFNFRLGVIFQFIGNSTQSTSYDSNCIFLHITSIDIIYLVSFYLILTPIIYFASYCIIAYILSKFKLGIFSNESIFCSLFYLTLTTKANYINQLILLAVPRKISGIQWISSNVSYQYQTITHLKLLKFYIIPALVLFSIIVPLILAFIFYQNRKLINFYQFKRKYGYLCNDYKNKIFYWEIIKLQKNEILVLFYVMFQETESLGLVLQIFLIFIYQNALSHWKPYSLEPLNKFEKQILNMIQMLLFFSLSQNLANDQQSDIQLISMLCKTILLIILILICSQKLIINFVNKYYKIIDQIKLKLIKLIQSQKLIHNSEKLLKIFELRQNKLNRIQKNFQKLRQSVRQGLSSPFISSSPLRSVPQYTLNSSQNIILKTTTARCLI